MKMFKTILAFILVFGISTVAYAQESGMMSSDPGRKPQMSDGAKIFNTNCARCHPNGGNVIVPNLPLRGSDKLSDFKTFLAFIRNPKMPDESEGLMPAFSQKQISDKEAKMLYRYITSAQSTGTLGGGYGMGPGMMGGYGMGPGMMGGYGMGPGMMGGYGMGRGMMGGYGMGPGMMGGYGMGPGMMGGYGMGPGMMGGYGMGRGMMGGSYWSEECQKFLDETTGLRKELHDKKFEYSEAYRNPKTTQGTLLKLDSEIFELQNKIYANAPLGCGW